MAHKKCKTKPCNCGDKGLTTQPPCAQDTPDCPNPENCAETFSGECIVYTGDTIVDNNIQYGDRFNDIVQKLSLMILNPNCTDILSPCQAALGVMTTAITTTSITVKWYAVETATSYIVQYKAAISPTWLSLPATVLSDNPSQVISGLIPNTEYHIRITSVCASGSCFSLTILNKTKLIV